jgi:hypothetical protein
MRIDSLGGGGGGGGAPSLDQVFAHSGDRMADIAARYGFSEGALRAANPGVGEPVAGQAIRLPAADTAAAAQASPAAPLTAERRAAIDQWVTQHEGRGVLFGRDVAEAARQMTPAEQAYLVDRSIDALSGKRDTYRRLASFSAALGEAAPQLSSAAGARLAERAAGFARQATVEGKGLDGYGANALAHAALAVADSRGAGEVRSMINGLGAEGAGLFADALLRGGAADSKRVATALSALNAGPENEVSRQFTIHAFSSAQKDFYLERSPAMAPMAAALARLMHPGDAAAQSFDANRLGKILATPAGAQLLAPEAPNEDASVALRWQALGALKAHPEVTADKLAKLDSAWTDPTIAQHIASAPARQLLQARGDESQALRGTDLDNTIGVALHLPPDALPRSETAQQVSAREKATAGGRYSYYAKQEPVTAVRDAIRDAAQAVGGDRQGPRVTVLPVQVSTAEHGPVQLALFRVDGPKGSQFVDNTGARYASFDEWRTRNKLPEGVMTFPPGGHLTAGADGQPRLQTQDTPKTHDTLGKVLGVVDKVALVGGIVAGTCLTFGVGGVLMTGIAVGATAYGAARAGQDLYDRSTRHQSLDPLTSSEARADWLNLFASGLSAGGVVAGPAARALSGANVVSPTMAGAVAAVRISAVAADAASMGNQTYELAKNWDRLSAADKAMAGLNLAFWGAGAGAQMRGGGARQLFDFEAQRQHVLAEYTPPVRYSDQLGSGVRLHTEGAGHKLGGTYVEAGLQATQADIELHSQLAQRLASQSGIEGWARRLMGEQHAPVGTRLYEAQAEVAKLGEVLHAAEAKLARPGTSAAEKAQLGADIEHYRHLQGRYRDELAGFERNPSLGLEPGRGYIEQPSGGAQMAESLGYPKIPAPNQHWVLTPEQDLIIRPNPDHGHLPRMAVVDGKIVQVATDPIRPTYKGDATTVPVDAATRTQVLDRLHAVRDEARKVYMPLHERELRGEPLTKAETGQMYAALQKMNDQSRLIGEQGAASAIKTRYANPELVYGGPAAGSKSGDFDQVWKVGDRYIVVEAKGGAAPLGSRRVGDDVAMQGTPEYFEKIVELMSKSKNPDTARLAKDIEKAAEAGKVSYVEARTPVRIGSDGRGSSPEVKLREFDLNRRSQ